MSPSAPTSLFGVLGKPVAGNPTQEMVEAAFRAAGLDARYVSLEVEPDALANAVRGVRALGFRGVHITVPHKVAVVPLLDELEPSARLSAAVNCIKVEGARLVGDNTDGKGFVSSLQGFRDPSGAVAVVLGAGGAARAIVAELALAGAAKIVVANRTLQRAKDVAAAIAEGTGVLCESAQLIEGWPVPADAQVVVQATTVGMEDSQARLRVDWSNVPSAAIVADVVIAPDTSFLRDARTHGLRTLDGLGMLVEQAVVALRWWTGVDPDTRAMRAALERELGLVS